MTTQIESDREVLRRVIPFLIGLVVLILAGYALSQVLR